MDFVGPRGAKPERDALLLVDDHELIRLGLRTLLRNQAAPAEEQLQILEAANLAEALALYARHESKIRLVLLDLALPDVQGLEGLATFWRRFPSARVAVLSGSASEAEAAQARALGVAAFLHKSADLGEVLSFVRASGLLKAQPVGDAARTGPLESLTRRQSEVLAWVLQGRSNKEIAVLAQLSEGTVKNHVSALLLLHGVRSRAQLISRLR
ncbi:response regulator transcription factor [Variovorax sp. LARHSF232]